MVDRPFTLAAAELDGNILNIEEIEENDIKSYLSDLEIEQLKVKEYLVNFFPLMFKMNIKISSQLGVRSIPHSSEKIMISKYLSTFFDKIINIKNEYVIFTFDNGRYSECENRSCFKELIQNEKKSFQEKTGISLY